ncbi:MAG: PAS domain-containing sensor histidine kinase [Rhizobiaceae bacterium]
MAYPYIDIAVLDGVRDRLAAGDGVLILDSNLETVIFANGPGAVLAGFDDPADLAGGDAELGISAIRQIRAQDLSAGPASLLLRLTDGFSSRTEAVTLSQVRLPGSMPAVMVSSVAAGGIRNAIDGLSQEGSHTAILDAAGSVLEASGDFASLHLGESDLAALAAAASFERDRMVKRPIRVGMKVHPAGIGRIADAPARYILLVVEDKSEPLAPQSEPISAPTFGRRYGEQGFAAPVERESAFVGRNESTPIRRAAPTATASRPTALRVFDAETPPVRFTWKIDAAGFFHSVSPEFSDAVGASAADIEGRTFSEVAKVFALDPTGDIGDLLARHDTWSGRSVLWPVEGTSLRVPVDLAALPIYDRERRFEGFRGFGIVRLADWENDPEAIGLALSGQPDSGKAQDPEPVEDTFQPLLDDEDDPWRGEPPALELIQTKPAPNISEKIIHLEERRSARDKQGETIDGSLTPIERNAFREIAERLRREGLAAAEMPASADDVRGTPHSGVSDEAVLDAIEPDLFAAHTPSQLGEPAAPIEIPSEADIDASAEDIDDLYRLDQASGGVDVFSADQIESHAQSDTILHATPAAQEASGADELLLATGKATVDEAPILSRLPVPILVHDGETPLFANQAFFDLTGHASLEALRNAGGLDRLFDPTASQAQSVNLNSVLRTAYDKTVPVRAHLHSVPWKGGHALLLSMRPLDGVTGESRPDETVAAALEAMKQEVAELSSVLETATDGVVFINSDGTIRTITQSAEALFGFDPAELNGKPFAILFATESQRTVNDYLANLSGTGVASLMNDGREVIGREAHGRFIPLFMTIGQLTKSTGYCAVLRDITQWKRAEEELNAAKRAAEQASAQKSEFLARVSHEIRTPLNAIIGFSDLMTEERFGPVGNLRYLDYLKDINRSGRHVLDLVNDLLDISKIEAGQQELDFEAVSLNEALGEAVSMLQPQANRNRVIIRSSFASDLPEVVADLRSVKQIALNLLSNAVRYTGAGGQVIVSTAYELTGGVAIRVRDTGVGMSPQEIEQAMKPFKQINALHRGRGDGTGLGLPLTKAMVEANRANFAISSTPGHGTLVEIIFPSTRVLAD